MDHFLSHSERGAHSARARESAERRRRLKIDEHMTVQTRAAFFHKEPSYPHRLAIYTSRPPLVSLSLSEESCEQFRARAVSSRLFERCVARTHQVAIAGLNADARSLAKYMRTECLNHKYVYGAPLQGARLVVDVADKYQRCTQMYVRHARPARSLSLLRKNRLKRGTPDAPRERERERESERSEERRVVTQKKTAKRPSPRAAV